MADLDRVPLNGLRAIEAVGRLGSLSRAAAELNITPGAVSQRIQKTETILGRPLFQRLSSGMVPTDLCAEMLTPLSRAMRDLARSVDIAGDAGRNTLTVSVAPLFASHWLVWRLGQFQAQHPDLRIRVEPSGRMLDPIRDGVDICLRSGKGDWPGVEEELMMIDHVFPVCNPALADGLRQPSDLTQAPIIHESPELPNWSCWLKGTGVALTQLRPGPNYADLGLCIDAAMAGQGVFLAWEGIAQDALDRGTLAEPFAPRRVAPGTGLWFVTAPGARRRRAVSLFYQWLRDALGPLAV